MAETRLEPRPRSLAGLLIIGLMAGVGLVALTLFILNSGPTSISQAVLARDFQNDAAVGSGTVFRPGDNPLHCVVELKNVSAGTKIRVVWTVLEAGEQQNLKLFEREIVAGTNQTKIDAFLTLNQPWPVGSYKVDLYLEGKLDRTLPFKIEGTGS